MDNNKKFKSSLFGFSRKSVSDYVLSLSEDFTKKIADLEAELKEAKEQIKEKDLKIAELDAQRLHVAETLLKSKVEADHIVSSAQTEASTMISDAESKASGMISSAETEASGMVSSAKNEAELIVDTARTKAVELKQTSENELKALKEQKDYVAQCINSLKLDVLSAYEVYMLKLEKSMELNGVISLEDGSIEVKDEEITAPAQAAEVKQGKAEEPAKEEEKEEETAEKISDKKADEKSDIRKEVDLNKDGGIFTPEDTKNFDF